MKREAQELYLQLNEHIVEVYERDNIAPPCWNKTDLFFPEDQHDYRKREETEKLAKGLCGGCHVMSLCLRYALIAQEGSGVWGGLTTRERQHILRTR